jgi:glycosyltransferase involved in cell wall biosynthesis
MKVLWFANTPSLYDQGKHSYHGGGWIESLELLVKEQKDIELGVSFYHLTDSEKVTKSGTTYFPILRKSARINPFKAVFNNWRGKFDEESLNDKFLNIINNFHPDVIHVFGTEGPFSKIQEITNIPVVIHIQGIINPYLNTYYPVNQSKWSFLLNKSYFLNNLIGNSPVFGKKGFITQAKREQNFLSKAKFIMGRTHWDRMVAELYNPKVKYFHIEEVLRDVFYQHRDNIKQKTNQQFKIISTLSPTVYKGIDVVLKCAKQLKELTNFDFKWEIIGLEENATLLKHFEKSEKIKHHEVNIICNGRKSPEEMIELMQASDVFVHPSYIDNSPNSVCEAQIIGLPVIACNVGGVSTLVQHENTGFLVPSNGVFELVHYLCMLHDDDNLRKVIGQKARNVAFERHNRGKIVSDLLMVYTELSN